jgi:hypothetical protein
MTAQEQALRAKMQDMSFRMMANRNALAPEGDKAFFLKILENSPVMNASEQVQLVKDIQDGKVSIRPFDITVIVDIDKATIKVFSPERNLDKGITSIRNAQLDAGRYFVPKRVKVLAGNADANNPSKAQKAAVTFAGLESFSGFSNLLNAILRLRIDGQVLFDDFSMHHFATAGNNNVPTGTFELSDSIVIPPIKEIKAEIEMADASKVLATLGPLLLFQMSGMATVPGA